MGMLELGSGREASWSVPSWMVMGPWMLLLRLERTRDPGPNLVRPLVAVTMPAISVVKKLRCVGIDKGFGVAEVDVRFDVVCGEEC